MTSPRLLAVPAAAVLLAMASASPARACDRFCYESGMSLCFWDDSCSARHVRQNAGEPRWRAIHARTITRFEIEAVRLLQRMP